METKELMISDWVHSTCYNVDAKIIDVNHDCVWLEVNGEWVRHIIEFVEPIKLTWEIISNNLLHKESGYTIGWKQNDDGTFVVWESDNEGNNVFMKHIQYVHEFQHMLRLVKCKKEIELTGRSS